MCPRSLASFSSSFLPSFDPLCLLPGRRQSGWFRRIDFGFELLFEESKTARGFVDPVLVTLSCLPLRRCFAGLARGEARHRS